MIQRLKAFFAKRSTLNILVYGYVAVSFLNLVTFFMGDFIYTLWGNHSIFYPFLGLLMLADTESQALAWFFLIYWGASTVWLVVSYIQIFKWKKYFMLQLAVFSDVVFVILFTLANIQYGGFMDLHIAMLFGALHSFGFGLYLCCYKHCEERRSGEEEKADSAMHGEE